MTTPLLLFKLNRQVLLVVDVEVRHSVLDHRFLEPWVWHYFLLFIILKSLLQFIWS